MSAQRKYQFVEDDWSKDKQHETHKDTNSQIRRVEKAAESVSNDLDKVIHERMRLGIISALAANESLSFNDLKKLLQTTDGNVSVHARKLEEAGYIECVKSFKGRTPLTEYKITAAGRESLERYLNHMEALIKAMKNF
jgi:DNA-binding MarR family transcriptional regulator